MINVIGSSPFNKNTKKTVPPAPGAVTPIASTAPPAPPTPGAFNPTSPTPTAQPQKPTIATKKVFKTKKKMDLKLILGLGFLILLIIGTIAGYLLTKTDQDIRQQAYKAGGAGLGSCTEICAGLAQGGINDLPCTCPSGCNQPAGTVVQPGQNCGGNLLPTVTPGTGSFCQQAGYSDGKGSGTGPVDCNGGSWCHDSTYNYCCFDHNPTGIWTPETGDTCHTGNTATVSCDDANNTINITSGTYTVVKFISHDNVSCPYNGPAISSSTYTGPASLGFGGNECGQIDVSGACGVCKATGCDDTTITSTPTPTPSPSSTPTPTPTPPPTLTPTPVSGECGSDCNSISCDTGLVCVTSDVQSEAGNAYCSLANITGGYQFENVCAANATAANASEQCCTTPTPTTTSTPTPTATPVPGECGADCSSISCDIDLECVESSAGSFCAQSAYTTTCASITDLETQDVGALCCSEPTVEPSETPTATPTLPAPGVCGGPCISSDYTSPCGTGLECIQGADGNKFCSMSEYVTACALHATTSSSDQYCCNDQTITPTVTPTPVQITVVTTKNCNDTCSSTADCSNDSHICYNSQCRLAQNPTDELCRMPDGTTQVIVYTQATTAPQQPVPPVEPIVAGPNWGKIIQVGLVALAIGALLLLFL
jgi:hypothetical protein